MFSIIQLFLPFLSDVLKRTLPDQDKRQEIEKEITLVLLKEGNAIQKKAADIVIAEVQGESWLQRNWRPSLMVWFSILVGAYWFGAVPENLSPEAVEKLFDIIQIGVGGYIVGRSAEKVASTIAPIFKKDD